MIHVNDAYAITSPAKAEVRRLNEGTSTECVKVVDPDSGSELSKLHIGRKPEAYDLWVGDVQINSANKDNIPNLQGGTGTYDPSANTLTLNGVNKITGTHDGALISTEMAGTLILAGSARLDNSNGSVVSTNGDIILKGDFNLYSAKGHTISAGTNMITVDGNLQARADESGKFALYSFGSAGGVTFLSGRTTLEKGKGGIYVGGDISFKGGELSVDVEENAFQIAAAKDLVFDEAYGFIEPEEAHIGTDPDNAYMKCALDGEGKKVNKVRIGLKSDGGLYIGFDDPILTKDAEGKYTAVYTGTAIKPEVLVKNNGKTLIEGVDYKLSYKKNVKVGTATVTVSGKGNYNKKVTLTFEIVKKNLADSDVFYGNLTYQKGKKPEPTVAYKGVILKAKKDYDLEVNGTLLTFKGKGNFTGETTMTAVEKEADAYKNATIIVKYTPGEKTYSGLAQTLSATELQVTDAQGITLTPYVDYDVSYSDNINAGTVKFCVVAKGMWNGKYSKNFKILPDNAAAINVYGLKASYTYNKYGVKPSIEVKAGEKLLKQGRDYTLTYKSNKNLGTGKIELKFIGNYKGSTYGGESSFAIVAAKPTGSSVRVVTGDMVFKKAAKYQPAVWVIAYGRLVNKKDLSIEYSEKDKLTEAKNGLTIAVSGKTNYEFTANASYDVLAADSGAIDVSKAKVSLVQGGKTTKKVPYTGKEIVFSSEKAGTPQITVKIGTTVLTGAEVEAKFNIYYADNIEKGKATIILKAKSGSGYAGACAGVFAITAMPLEQK
ncbi:MAG: hypothetical protein J6X66_08955 [Lachnospiraceae bacterium]|nr:hypothetical protein [Lachnospiraceae bacterium]